MEISSQKKFLPAYSRQHKTKWHIQQNTKRGNETLPMQESSSTKYSNGKPGGFASISSTEDIDLPPTKWVQLHGEGTPPSPRGGVSCNFWKTRGVYVFFGGSNEGAGESTIFEDVFTFNPSTKIWREAKTSGQAPLPRRMHTSVILRDSLYILGGKGRKHGKHSKRAKNEWFRDAYELDMKSWTWTRVSTDSGTGISMIMKNPIQKCFPFDWDGDPHGIIAFGSNDKDAGTSQLASRKGLLDHFYLNLSSGVYLTPMASGDVPTKRHSYSIVHYSNHLNYVASNIFDSSSDNQATAKNSCFILFGGTSGKEKFAETYAFFPYHSGYGKWKKLKTANNPTARYGHTASIINGVMVVVGGYNEGWRNDVCCLDLSSLVWYEPDELARFTLPPRESHVSFTIEGNLAVFGGSCWPVCRNDLQCLVNTRAIVAGCKRKGGASYNENESAKAVNLARRSKKQKPGAGTLKRGLIRKTSSNDSTSLSSNYVFTSSGNVGDTRSRSSSNSSSVDAANNDYPFIKLAAPSDQRRGSESPRTLSISMSPSYHAVKKHLSAGNANNNVHGKAHTRGLNSSMGEYYSAKKRSSSPYTLESVNNYPNQQRTTFPSILGKSRVGGTSTFMTEIEKSPERSRSKSPIKRRMHKMHNNMNNDVTYEAKMQVVETNMQRADKLTQTIEELRGPLMQLKKNVETEEANTEQTKKAHETTVLNEKKTLNTLRKKEEKVRVKVGEMLRALDEATHMYKENEKQLLQQKRLKDNAMKAQQEATNTINRLKDDLEKLYTAGDKISEEDMQLSQDITHLKALLKTQRKKKDDMKQHLHDVQERRKLAEKEVEEQQKNLELLRLESEMLYADLKGDM